MTMSDVLMAILSTLSGLALGAIFFVGLWWTIHRALASPQPGALVLVSMVGRTGLVVAGFYFASGVQWQRLLFCLAGFVLARMLVTRLLRNSEAHGVATVAEASHHAP